MADSNEPIYDQMVREHGHDPITGESPSDGE